MKVKLSKRTGALQRTGGTAPKAIVVWGDGTDQDLLIEEGVLEVDGFVALTGIDEENMIISLFAKDNTNAKVVTKISRKITSDWRQTWGWTACVAEVPHHGHVLSYVRSWKASPAARSSPCTLVATR
ncbi:MAG: NAD-binding protein [Ruminococcus sp.]